MRTLHLALSLVLASSVVACGDAPDGSDDDGGAGGAGGSGASSSGAAGDGPRVGHDGVATNSEPPPSGGTGAGGREIGSGGSGSGGADDVDCESCCTGTPVPGLDTYYMRVDDSNSFASPLLTRSLLARWDGQRALPVRANEYLNFYAPPVDPIDGAFFAASDGAMPVAVGSAQPTFALQIAIRHVPAATETSRAIAVVVDTSPSAAGAVEEILGSVDAVFAQVAPSDLVGVYTWATDPDARIIRPFALVEDPVTDLDRIRERVQAELARRDENASLAAPLRDALRDTRERVGSVAGGGTVVLVSDGTSGVGTDTLEVTREEADALSPVRVLGVGVGDPLYYSDEVLDAVTDASGGAYVYFDGSPEARALLDERFRELSETAAADVRLKLELPGSVTPVTPDGSVIASGTGAAVRGQNLGWGGTMTFHEPLAWKGGAETECDAITWHVVSGRDGTETELATGMIVVGDVFGGRYLTPSMIEGAAVVAVADALRGPTSARIAEAFAALAKVAGTNPTRWEASALPGLCATLQQACETKGFACRGCQFEAPPGD